MSTAQTIRDAAVTWPMPYLSDAASMMLAAMGTSQRVLFNHDTHFRTYMLIVAASLDGGERLPINKMQKFRFAMDYLHDGYGLILAVEQHHGIGVSK